MVFFKIFIKCRDQVSPISAYSSLFSSPLLLHRQKALRFIISTTTKKGRYTILYQLNTKTNHPLTPFPPPSICCLASYCKKAKEISFLAYYTDGQPNWSGKLCTTTLTWLSNTECHADSWRLGECWQGMPAEGMRGNQYPRLLMVSASSNEVVTVALPSASIAAGRTGILHLQEAKGLQWWEGSAEGRGECAALKQNCLIHLLWWKISTIVKCEIADLAGKIHNQSQAILTQINRNRHNFSFHTVAQWSFYYATKVFFSHQ